MSTKALVIGIVGAGCIAAAGVGGFVAQRLSPTEPASRAALAAESTADLPTTTVVAEPGLPTADAAMSALPPPSPPTPQRSTARPTSVPRSPAAQVAPPASPPAPQAATEAPPSAPPAPPPPAVEPPQAEPSAAALEPSAAMPAGVPLPALEDDSARFIELTVEENSVIGIRLENAVTTERARLEDRVTARVIRDVVVDGRTAIPAGALLEGDVVLVEQGGRFRERARLGIRFTRLLLSDETAVRIQTEPIYRDGESPVGEATSKIGASAVIGAILGGVVGGKKGAAIGGSAGAAGGSAAVAAGGPNPATLAEGTALTVRLTGPVTLLIERDDRER